ncbi:dipeptidase 1-like [Saccoglossus kowalevskii]|uniref:Dipeptidase n=1 Tax=Saccoglossus kowalevskii TaxID=10224 RepID=A0ABM0GVT1_SACKO|nr:PREDICTED: dipeptidase 1-like [Saccoglossus kowalevskii]
MDGDGSISQEPLISYGSKRTRKIIVVAFGVGIAAAVIAIAIAVPLASNSGSDDKTDTGTDTLEHAKDIMRRVPLVDGHNDLPLAIRYEWKNQLANVDLNSDLSSYGLHTDIPRLREGLVGGQFWSVYVPCDSQYNDAVRQTLDQIDLVKRYVKQYSDTFAYVTTAQGIVDAFVAGKIGSLIGMEGGHSVDSTYSNLRMMYDVGARYMTLTHSCNTPWADNSGRSEDDLEFGGLSDWGKDLIREMNRLGMLVDLSHVSVSTMNDALDVSQSPVIFSHSAARTLCDNTRNVPDEVLERLVENGGIVMMVFYPGFINCEPNKQEVCDIPQVADHIEHIASVCGYGCVGIGSDYDGISVTPVGLEDVSKYPYLIEEMVIRNWTDENIEKLIGRNLIRVMQEVERVRDTMSDTFPYEEWIERNDSKAEFNNECRTHEEDGWASYPSSQKASEHLATTQCD